ncbi:Sugar lactone lactonase YvrE [Loktanella fryxellensis]|uniref:Sugar lactone lactonase YvrE n=1 Tax=Loktanella fryxellensis TaxID=245187 RepID=A0A1H8ATW4_9RHOB|nr:SMP-30/gluconolactonase/LRE family protein [Loktanella fryxellensis]SEM74192.1 Sugar lactone lactonase YvrE [Loktanella fryxellensis]
MSEAIVFDPTPCILGEGPLWHPEREQLFWFDIITRRMHTRGQHWDFDGHVSAAGWIDYDTLLVASEVALMRFDIASGDRTKIMDLEHDMAGTRSNDGRADPQGGFWIGTMGLGAEAGHGSIWRYYRGELRHLYRDLAITNAISFAPDGTTAYFADTTTQQIMRVALDAHGWPAGDPQVHIDLTGTDFHPDGAVVDAAGNLFSAQWGTGRVAVYDPRGAFIEHFAFPALHTSCPAFGGTDLYTLYVTSARQGLTDPDDAQGATYAVRTRYTGQREHRVIL